MKRIFKEKLLFVFAIVIGFTAQAQTPTIGLRYNNWKVSEGYTLFTPGKNNFTYLIDNCGEVVNQWEFNENPGATCYLLENGTILRAGKNNLEIRDWDNNLLWSYLTTENGIAQHHDIEPLPNGNILCVVRTLHSVEEMTEEGRDPSITEENFKLDKIVELEPVGTEEANIVWEWRYLDHFIQDFDETKENYGVVADHPELIDINFDNNATVDFTHVNAIDYNAELDHIIIMTRNLSEMIIIDHSTTTEEAAGHTGGVSNKGGDLLWRWGNPQVYRQGDASDQMIFLPHDSKWVESGYADDGKISVFNNKGDGSGDFSSVHMLTPSFSNNEYEMENGVFLPTEFDWSWDGKILGDTMSEPIKSGFHGLQNGNVILCESGKGQITELNKAGEVLWVYKNPSSQTIINQGEEFTAGINTIFRGEKYPLDFPGFEGKDLTPQGIIEDVNTVSAACVLTIDVEDVIANDINIINPVINNTIRFSKNINSQNVIISDLSGKTIYQQKNFTGSSINVELLPAVYILQMGMGNTTKTYKIIAQ